MATSLPRSAATNHVQCDDDNRKYSKNGATALNFSGYVGHATIFSRMLTTASCIAVWLGLGLGLYYCLLC